VKALIYTQPLEMRYLTHDDPSVGPGEALVEIRAAGICGSDMHAFHGHDPRRKPPLILGHEAAGVSVSGNLAGRPVVINPLISCGYCEYCGRGRFNLCPNRTMIGMSRPGTLAERVSVPERNLVPLPDGMNPVHAALTEPTATALHGLSLAARIWTRPLAEAQAAVIGGGSVGLLSALLLKAYGSRGPVLSEPNPLRRETAARVGIAGLHDPSVQPLAGDSFDLVVDAVGSSGTRAAALEAARPGAVVLSIGLLESGGNVDARKLTLAELTLVGCYTYTPADIRAAVGMLASGALGTLEWVDARPLAEGPLAFEELDAGQVAAAKVVLTPG